MYNLYVDDSSNSFDDVQECIKFFEISKKCLSDANFILRKWNTNDPDLQKFLNESNETNTNETIRKVLGLQWNLKTDEFVFEFSNIIEHAQTLKLTKRNILKNGGIFFDPLGFFSPLTLKPKLLFQEACSNKLGWDSEISVGQIFEKWGSFLRELKLLSQVHIPRHVLCCHRRSVQLHGFCDSSAKAFSAAVYIRIVCSHEVQLQTIDQQKSSRPFQIIIHT